MANPNSIQRKYRNTLNSRNLEFESKDVKTGYQEGLGSIYLEIVLCQFYSISALGF